MKLNMNKNVKVKLNTIGKEELHRQYKEINKTTKLNFPFVLPEEDSDGYSTWQLWVLMNTFGNMLSWGHEFPFDLEIEIIEEVV